MSHFLNHPEIFNLPLHLTNEQKENPHSVIETFFTDYHLCDLREHLWNQMEACLTTDNTLFSDPVQRADLIYHHEQMEKLLEAVFLLFKPQTKVSK